MVLCSASLDFNCKQRGKKISGIIARVTNELYEAMSPPAVGLESVWRHMQALSLCQMRQLLESSLWDAAAPETEYEDALMEAELEEP